MNQPRTVFTVMLACCVHLITAQAISPSVIATAGGLASNTDGSLSYTIGEMAMIESFTTQEFAFTQGFQQPWDFITSVDAPHINVDIAVYPNPASDFFYLQLQSSTYTKAHIQLRNVLGSTVYHELVAMLPTATVHSVGTHAFPAGIYILSVTGIDNRGQSVMPLSTKIHIAH